MCIAAIHVVIICLLSVGSATAFSILFCSNICQKGVIFIERGERGGGGICLTNPTGNIRSLN